jgi:hypothetical protein
MNVTASRFFWASRLGGAFLALALFLEIPFRAVLFVLFHCLLVDFNPRILSIVSKQIVLNTIEILNNTKRILTFTHYACLTSYIVINIEYKTIRFSAMSVINYVSNFFIAFGTWIRRISEIPPKVSSLLSYLHLCKSDVVVQLLIRICKS